MVFDGFISFLPFYAFAISLLPFSVDAPFIYVEQKIFCFEKLLFLHPLWLIIMIEREEKKLLVSFHFRKDVNSISCFFM